MPCKPHTPLKEPAAWASSEIGCPRTKTARPRDFGRAACRSCSLAQSWGTASHQVGQRHRAGVGDVCGLGRFGKAELQGNHARDLVFACAAVACDRALDDLGCVRTHGQPRTAKRCQRHAAPLPDRQRALDVLAGEHFFDGCLGGNVSSRRVKQPGMDVCQPLLKRFAACVDGAARYQAKAAALLLHHGPADDAGARVDAQYAQTRLRSHGRKSS